MYSLFRLRRHSHRLSWCIDLRRSLVNYDGFSFILCKGGRERAFGVRRGACPILWATQDAAEGEFNVRPCTHTSHTNYMVSELP